MSKQDNGPHADKVVVFPKGCSPVTATAKHNQMLIDRIVGVPSQPGTLESDSSPNNPNHTPHMRR